MMIVIENLLPADVLEQIRERLAAAEWEDGAGTAGAFARGRKHNLQLRDGAEPAQSLGQLILERLWANPRFISAALPRKIYPPRFNSYADGQNYGPHVDSALMRPAGADWTMRTDLSATLFISDPDSYDGGALEIEGQAGTQAVKLNAGDMVLYPASSLHRVTPVMQGRRLASFFWIESLVADDSARELLFDLDQGIQRLTLQLGAESAELTRLTGVYHNLLRRWAVT